MKKYKKYNLDATDENIMAALKNNDYARADAIKDFIGKQFVKGVFYQNHV